jgi:tRNA nucleotidyltransferase/poly(A) polymerase
MYKILREVEKIHNIFRTANYDLYLVGGCVRDILLGEEPDDFDLVTNAPPDKIEELLENDYSLDLTGKVFAVMRIFSTEASPSGYEIATYRKDVTVGRKPEVKFKGVNIQDDALRRDFTINSLYMHPITKRVLDFTGGREDLESTPIKIQTPGIAEERFNEDRIRILRAYRFKHRFSGVFSEQIEKAIAKNNKLIGPDAEGKMVPIAQESKLKELYKAFKQVKSVTAFINDLYLNGILEQLFPTVKLDVVEEIIYRDPVYVIAHILKVHYKDQTSTFDVYRYLTKDVKTSATVAKRVDLLLRLQQLSTENVHMLKKSCDHNHVDPNHIVSFYEDSRMHKYFSTFKLIIKGESLIEKGFNPGVELGKEIARLETERFIKHAKLG